MVGSEEYDGREGSQAGGTRRSGGGGEWAAGAGWLATGAWESGGKVEQREGGRFSKGRVESRRLVVAWTAARDGDKVG